jgi:hypothetical protein
VRVCVRASVRARTICMSWWYNGCVLGSLSSSFCSSTTACLAGNGPISLWPRKFVGKFVSDTALPAFYSFAQEWQRSLSFTILFRPHPLLPPVTSSLPPPRLPPSLLFAPTSFFTQSLEPPPLTYLQTRSENPPTLSTLPCVRVTSWYRSRRACMRPLTWPLARRTSASTRSRVFRFRGVRAHTHHTHRHTDT